MKKALEIVWAIAQLGIAIGIFIVIGTIAGWVLTGVYEGSLTLFNI